MEKITKYRAYDGTLFETEKDCLKYDKENLKIDIICEENLRQIFPNALINFIMNDVLDYVITHYNTNISKWDEKYNSGFVPTDYKYSDIKQIKLTNIEFIDDSFDISLDYIFKDNTVIVSKDLESARVLPRIKDMFKILSDIVNQSLQEEYNGGNN